MLELSIQQKQSIAEFRKTHNQYILNDEAVISLMQKEMRTTGVVFKGFESLAAPKDEHKRANSAFGRGFYDNETPGISVEKTTPYALPDIKIPEAHAQTINFLKEITGEAQAVVQNHSDENGTPMELLNDWWFEYFDKENAKSTVTNEISKTKSDIAVLEQAANGALLTTNYFTGETKSVSFEEAFKKQRGVEFNEEAIVEAQEKAEEFSRIKTVKSMVDKTKSELAVLTKGDVKSQMGHAASVNGILQALKLSGVGTQKEINQILKSISQKYEDHPDVKKYGGDFKLEKTKSGKWTITRTDKRGERSDAPNEELKLIAKEISARLDNMFLSGLGKDIPQNATPDELSMLTQKVFEERQKDYENSFSKAFGKKELKALSEKYVQNQQSAMNTITEWTNIGSVALMITPGALLSTSGWLLKGSVALKNTASGLKTAKALGLVDKAKKTVKFAQGFSKVSQAASPIIIGNMILNPTELWNKLSSKNGMSEEEWKQWGIGVLQNSSYMALGMGASKLAETGAAMYKTNALVKTLKQAGHSSEKITAMVKANPVKFPKDIVQSFKKIDNMSKALQVNTEVALDISTTYLANQALGNGDVTKQDWIMSVGFALSGGVLQKQFAPLSTDAKVKYIKDAFKELNITQADARNILKTMDDISAGKIRVKKETNINTEAVKPAVNELPEVVVKPETNKINIPKGKFAAPNAKFAETPEAFAGIISKKKYALEDANHLQDNAFYNEVYSILTKEMDLSDKIAPKIVLTNIDMPGSGARSAYDCFDNTITIYGNNYPKDRAEGVALLAHELKHFLQFKEELLTEGIGLEGVINAKTEDVLRKNPDATREQAYNAVVSEFTTPDGTIKEHILSIYDDESYPINEADDKFGLQAQKYAENDEHYIDKAESLKIDGTYRAYEDQAVEKEAYDVSDAVGTAFNREVLGIDKPVRTREYAKLVQDIIDKYGYDGKLHQSNLGLINSMKQDELKATSRILDLIDQSQGKRSQYWELQDHLRIINKKILQGDNLEIKQRAIDILNNNYKNAIKHFNGTQLLSILENITPNNIELFEELVKRHNAKTPIQITTIARYTKAKMQETINKEFNVLPANIYEILAECNSKDIQGALLDVVKNGELDDYAKWIPDNNTLDFKYLASYAENLQKDINLAKRIFEMPWLRDEQRYIFMGLSETDKSHQNLILKLCNTAERNVTNGLWVVNSDFNKISPASLRTTIDILESISDINKSNYNWIISDLVKNLEKCPAPEIINAYKQTHWQANPENQFLTIIKVHSFMANNPEFIDDIKNCLKKDQNESWEYLYNISRFDITPEMRRYIFDNINENTKFYIPAIAEFADENTLPFEKQKLIFEFIDKLNADKSVCGLEYKHLQILPHLNSGNFEMINHMANLKDTAGNPKYNINYIDNYLRSTTTFEQEMLPLDDINRILDISGIDGKAIISADKLKDYLCSSKLAQALKTEVPQEFKLTTQGLYEKSFQKLANNGEIFGCKNFKEFEEYLKTCTNRAEAGKMLGLIKKSTLDDFMSGLSDDIQQALIGETGTFTAKDFDAAIKRINENPTLEKLFYTIKTSKNDEYIDVLCAKLLYPDLEMAELFYKLPSMKTFRKDYASVKDLMNVFDKKLKEFISHLPEAQKEDLDDSEILKVKKEHFENLLTALQIAGYSNMSAIVHNESVMKQITLAEQLTKQVKKGLVDDLGPIYKSNTLKDNEIKQFIAMTYGLVDSGQIIKLKKLINSAKDGNSISMDKLYKEIYKEVINQVDEKLPTQVNSNLNGWDKNYFPYLIGAINSAGESITKLDAELLKEIIKTTINGDYEKFLYNPYSINGRANIQTRKQFEEMGLNFDQWMNFKGKKEFTFTPKNVPLDNIIKSIENDLEMLYTNPKIKALVEETTAGSGIKFDGKNLVTPDCSAISNKNLSAFVDDLMKFTNKHGIQLKNANMLDVKDHFKIRSRALKQQITNTTPQEMSISLWKRDPKHDLFQGHYCQCCISLDGVNGRAIIHSLAHNVDNIIELKNSSGETIGKAKMLWLKNEETGEPMLLANGFEITGQAAYSDQIRTEFTEFMKDYSLAVAGKEVPILTGIVAYQKINIDDLPDYTANIKLLGKFPDDTYHLDSFAEHEQTSWPKELSKPRENFKTKILYMPEK